MFRVLHTNGAMAYGDYLVDPNSQFEPGYVAQLTTHGNQIVCGTSDGRAPIGIIDDYKLSAFSAAAWDEVVIANVHNVSTSGSKLISTYNEKAELVNPYVLPGSFVSIPCDVMLNETNGIITFPAGTELNYDEDGDGIPDSIRTVVRYSYRIPNIPSDDTTNSSGRVTIWFGRIIAATDIYDTSADYGLNTTLFCGQDGKITSERIDETFPVIGIVTGPPTLLTPWLEFKLML
jgi:hypothetical protein